MLWDELVKVALIGTDRSNLSETSKTELSRLGIDSSKDPVITILEGAAICSLMQKTGSFPKSWPKPIPPKSPKDHGFPCSKKSRNHLKLILKRNYPGLLSEYIFHLNENKKLLPYDYIPELLEQSLSDENLWHSIKAAIGQRGHWLIAQNPDWQALNFEPQLAVWQTGSRDQRVQLLNYIRAKDPRAAIPLIQSTWEQDDLQSKVQFIQCLEKNDFISDEDFLEECLDNSRKEIRSVAANILSGIAKAKRNKRIFKQLIELMDYSPAKLIKQAKLSIKLPETLTDDMIRDGIASSGQGIKGGVKAGQLSQMIAIVPPHYWEVHFNKTAKEMLLLFMRTEWAALLLQAVSSAAVIHKNHIWAEEILMYWLENFQNETCANFDPATLIKNINAEVFNKVAIQGISKNNSLQEEDAPLTIILRTVNLPWQDALAQSFILLIQKWIAGETQNYWNGWHLRPILKKAALYTSPKLFDQIAKSWPSLSPAWTSWEKDVDSYLSVLKFRNDFIQELEAAH